MIVQRIRTSLWWAFGAAVAAGTLQVVIASVRRFALDQFIWVSRDFVWMTPLGYVLIFGALVLPVVAASFLLPSRFGERLPAFTFASLGTLAVVLMFPRLHVLAMLLLAVGAGVQAAARVAKGPGAGRRGVSRWILGCVAILGVAGVVREFDFRAAESKALASLPPAPPAAPNVLLIILDTVRAASMSFMGYARETTPRLARLAASGVVFDQAYSTAPWTLPSHAGIFTTEYPSTLTTDWRQPLDERPRTVAESFRGRGYVTSGFAANHFYTSWESGLTRGFVHYEDYRRTWKQVLLSTTLLQTNFFWSVAHDLRPSNILGQLAHLDLRTQLMWTSDRKLASLTADQFLAWERGRGSRPFFAFINLYDAHLPYDPPGGWARRFSSKPALLDRYDGAIAYMDQEIGRVLDELDRRGVLDQTLVIVSSDHGEGFGEHGLHGHGNSLYRPELHVPLVIRYPARVPSGRRVDAAVSLRDLAATMFDLTGLHVSGLGGVSLAGSWGPAGDSAMRSPVISEVSKGINTEPRDPVSRGAMRSLIDATSHYIRNGDGVEELYQYRTDPDELHDGANADSGRVSAMREAANEGAGRTRSVRR